MFKNLGKLLPTIIFILIAVIASMMLLSYFNINMSDNNGLKLNRHAIFEGNENILVDEKEKEEEEEED